MIKTLKNKLKKLYRKIDKKLVNYLKKQKKKSYVMPEYKAPKIKPPKIKPPKVCKDIPTINKEMSIKIKKCSWYGYQDFNYFCMFTYDDKKIKPNKFKKKLERNLKSLHFNNGWDYIGAWQYSKTNERLVFRALIYIPDKKDIGGYEEIASYSYSTHTRITCRQNKYFADKFGRNDFVKIEDEESFNKAIKSISGLIEKSKEKIVYSKNLPMYYISDLLGSEIVATHIGEKYRVIVYRDVTD